MRRTLIATVLLAVLALLGPASSAQTTDEGEGQRTATLEIVKVVDGEGPIGGYVIEYTCIENGIDASPAEGGGGSGGALAFDAAGPGSPETQTIVLTNAATCTVTETDSNGATTVTYACAYVASENPRSATGGFATEVQRGGCLDVQSAYIGAPGDVATITVTNTFDADEPPAVDDDDVVDATPAFTG